MNHITEEKIYALALYEAQGLGSAGLRKLLDAFGSPAEIMEQKEEEIEKVLGRKLVTNIFSKHRKNRDGFWQDCYNAYQKMESEGIHFCYCREEEYPKRLLEIPDYPFGLYYKGSLPKENLPCVSIIGARECSEYGRKCAELYGKILASYGVQIISGMARGVDGISQTAALEVGGTSFGILGSGVDVCYPRENSRLYEALIKEGGVISEFAPGTEAKSSFFPMRNRIISGLADILLVVEARKKSGTYITVCQALEQGKEIFAVPGRITDGLSDGCNRLIEAGAGIATDPVVILEALGCMEGNLNSQMKIETAGKARGIKTTEGAKTVEDGAKVQENHRDNSSDAADENLPNIVEDHRKREYDVLFDDEADHVEKCAVMKALEETPKRMEEILEEIRHYGVDLSYTDLLCLLTELCIEGRAEGGGDYYRAIR